MVNAQVSCRSCGQRALEPILSLGATPLANSLLSTEELAKPEPRYPLDLVLCSNCALIQITETVSPELLFEDYLYLSSYSDTMVSHARAIAVRMVERHHLGATSLVVELGSNDGYLLQFYQQAGVPVLGIDPARNIARVANEERDIPTISEFFGLELSHKLVAEGKRADVVHAHNVLAHVADLNGFVEGIRLLLKRDGVAVIEAPYVKDLIDQVEFDTIYHEHLCYFSVTSLQRLFANHDLAIVDVERTDIHGGSLRVFVTSTEATEPVHPRVTALLVEEVEWGAGKISFYRNFGSRVKRLRSEMVALLGDLKSKGKSIAVYGASAKGCTLLSYFGIGAETLDFVVDRSQVKQGLYTPGTHLPIRPPEKLLEDAPDYVLLLTWNFADEILEQQAEYRRRGGRFVIPIPELSIV